MVILFLLLGCNLSYIVDLFAGLHELASASARTFLKLASSVRALLKPYGDTLSQKGGIPAGRLSMFFLIAGDRALLQHSLDDSKFLLILFSKQCFADLFRFKLSQK